MYEPYKGLAFSKTRHQKKSYSSGWESTDTNWNGIGGGGIFSFNNNMK